MELVMLEVAHAVILAVLVIRRVAEFSLAVELVVEEVALILLTVFSIEYAPALSNKLTCRSTEMPLSRILGVFLLIANFFFDYRLWLLLNSTIS